MTTHILGDNGPRKSKFDPDLARKVTQYYEEHPEELNDKPEVPPIPTDTTPSAGKYILMPQIATYALGIRALQEECIKENNPNHPQFTLPDNSKIYRPLTFKENIKARVENYERILNSDGRERTLEERLFFITEQWNDSCTAIVNKAGTTKFKIVPLSEHLITLNPGFDEDFLPVDYNSINGMELDFRKGHYTSIMSQDAVLEHAGWLAAVEEDKVLLKSYTNIIFTELKRQYDRTEGMAFFVQRDVIPTGVGLRGFCVYYLGEGSCAYNLDLAGEGSFLRVAPPDGAKK